MSIMHGRGVGNTVCDRLMGSDWVVYAKPCVSGAETVVAYLGRYNHRTALTDGRLLGFDGAQVHLAYNDYRDGDRRKVMALDAEELLRRFLLHVLPKGFMRIRHFGLLANRCRRQCLAMIRTAVAASAPETETAAGQAEDVSVLCPACRRWRLRPASPLLPQPRRRIGQVPLSEAPMTR